jgi:hypothetical protein
MHWESKWGDDALGVEMGEEYGEDNAGSEVRDSPSQKSVVTG